MDRHGLTDILATVFDRTVRDGCIETSMLDGPPMNGLLLDLEEIGFDLVDYRDHPRSKDFITAGGRRLNGRGRARGTRKIENVTAVMYHQTASVWVDDERWLNVPAHAGVGDDAVYLLHDMQAYMYHGHGANKFAVGIEVMCYAAGIEGNPETIWGDKSRLQEATDAQLAAAYALGRYYFREALWRHGRIVTTMDHRNSANKPADPGSRIHKACTRRLADMYGLTCGVPVIGKGTANPTAWSGKPNVRYNWKIKGF